MDAALLRSQGHGLKYGSVALRPPYIRSVLRRRDDGCVLFFQQPLYQQSRIRLIVHDKHLYPAEVGVQPRVTVPTRRSRGMLSSSARSSS